MKVQSRTRDQHRPPGEQATASLFIIRVTWTEVTRIPAAIFDVGREKNCDRYLEHSQEHRDLNVCDASATAFNIRKGLAGYPIAETLESRFKDFLGPSAIMSELSDNRPNQVYGVHCHLLVRQRVS